MNTSAPSTIKDDEKLLFWALTARLSAYASVFTALIAMTLGWFGEYWPTRMLGFSSTVLILVTPALIMMIRAGRKKRALPILVVMAIVIWGLLGFLFISSLTAL